MGEKIIDGSDNIFRDLGLENADELRRQAEAEIKKVKKEGRETGLNFLEDDE